MEVNHIMFCMLLLYLRHYWRPGGKLAFLPPGIRSHSKFHFQHSVSTDPAVSRDVPAPLSGFNRIGPSPRQ